MPQQSPTHKTSVDCWGEMLRGTTQLLCIPHRIQTQQVTHRWLSS